MCARSTTPPDAPAGRIDDALSAHHGALDAACLELMGAAHSADPRALAQRWREVERDLLEHMAAEEQLMLPEYGEHDPDVARALRNEHTALRDHMFELGVAVQFHALRWEALQYFVDELRAHARREELILYRWAEDHIDPDARERLLRIVR